jgi:hypothetical protein
MRPALSGDQGQGAASGAEFQWKSVEAAVIGGHSSGFHPVQGEHLLHAGDVL